MFQRYIFKRTNECGSAHLIAKKQKSFRDAAISTKVWRRFIFRMCCKSRQTDDGGKNPNGMLHRLNHFTSSFYFFNVFYITLKPQTNCKETRKMQQPRVPNVPVDETKTKTTGRIRWLLEEASSFLHVSTIGTLSLPIGVKVLSFCGYWPIQGVRLVKFAAAGALGNGLLYRLRVGIPERGCLGGVLGAYLTGLVEYQNSTHMGKEVFLCICNTAINR